MDDTPRSWVYLEGRGKAVESELSWGVVALIVFFSAIVLWVFLFGLLHFLWSLYYCAYRPRRAFKRFCDFFRVSPSPQFKRATIQRGSKTVEARFIGERHEIGGAEQGFPPVANQAGPILELSSRCEFPVSFALTSESMFDKAGKVSGLTKEDQTTDPEFDRRIYVSCDTPDALREYLTSERRALILELLGRDFQRLSYAADVGRLSLYSTTKFFCGFRSIEPGRIVDGFMRLIPAQDGERWAPLFTQSAPSRAQQACDRRIYYSWYKRIPAFVFIGLILSGVYFFRWAYELVSPLTLAKAAITPTLVVSVFLLLPLIKGEKGRSTAHRIFLSQAIFLVALLYVPLCVAILIVNAAFDYSEPTSRQAIFKRINEHYDEDDGPLRDEFVGAWKRSFRTAGFYFEDAEGAAHSVSVLITESEAENLKDKAGIRARIFLKPGLFGLEHASGYVLEQR